MAGILQHIEEAGVHSGDSACAIPPYSLSPAIIAEIERQTRALALALEVKGLMNIQFAVKDERGLSDRGQSARQPRPCRSSPRRSGGRSPRSRRGSWPARNSSSFDPIDRDIGHIAVKESVFPFARFPGTDPVLSPEMKSTGEVMGISDNFDIAFAKSQLGGGIILPDAGTVFVSVKETDKAAYPARGEADGRAWLQPHRDQRHRAPS